jgi:hypothetical protein
MRKYQLMQVASQEGFTHVNIIPYDILHPLTPRALIPLVQSLALVFGVSALSGKTVQWEYVAKNREGDHICYISDLTKMRQHYPEWDITKSLDDIFREIYEATQRRGSSRREPVLF